MTWPSGTVQSMTDVAADHRIQFLENSGGKIEMLSNGDFATGDLQGWQVNKGWLSDPVAGQQAPFQVQVSEADGAPLQFAQVSGIFQRPSDSRLDYSFAMQEIEPGLYRIILALPEPGTWDLVLTVKRGAQMHELHGSTSVAEAGN